MTAPCVSTGTTDVSLANAITAPVSSKSRIQLWAPVVIGAFCLLQGLRLVLGADPIGNLMGVTLLVSVPGCLFAANRERKRQCQAAK